MSVGNILEESWVYQDILKKGHDKGFLQGEAKGLEEGEVKGLVQSILRLGTKKFGTPETPVEEKIRAITDIRRLEEILDEVLNAASWNDIVKP